MADTARDLRGRYPFVYIGDDAEEDAYIAQAVAGVLDARLVVELPAGAGDGGIVATVSGAGNGSVSFAVRGQVNLDVDVPVFYGRDNDEMLLQSPGCWLVAETGWDLSSLSSVSQGVLQLHPMCMRLSQRPPRLLFMPRETVLSGEDSDESGAPDISSSATALEAVSDGRNVAVSCDGARLVFAATAGAGLGAYPADSAGDMYTDLSAFDELRESGLRSLNGHTGQVALSGSGTVAVVTPGDPPGTVKIQINALNGGQ